MKNTITTCNKDCNKDCKNLINVLDNKDFILCKQYGVVNTKVANNESK